MAYVKNCNPGKITMDLPWKNYIYELPLFSFSDLYGGLALSLVFNHNMKADSRNPYYIAEGYKLNVHKRIVFEDGIPVAVEEANGNLVYLDGENGVYAFQDESHRVLRASGTTFVLENPDFSCENYNSAGNIIASNDKYGLRCSTYSYSTGNKLTSIVYRNSKTIQFTYSSNQLSKITYAGNTIAFAYTSASANPYVVTINHYSGEKFSLSYSRSGSSYEPDTISTFSATENSTSVTYAVKAVRNNGSFVLTDLISGSAVNNTSYNIHGNTTPQVEITNNEGVKTRVQYEWKYPLCAYEINSDAEFFGESDIFKNKFKGNVQMMSMQSLPTSNGSSGLLSPSDGTSFPSFSNGLASLSVSGNGSSSGYYIVSGWIKSNTAQNTPITATNIGVGVSTSALMHYPVDLTPVGQWKFFSCMVYAPTNTIVVSTGDPLLNKANGNIYVKDWRLSFQKTGQYTDGEPAYTNMTEYVLKNGNEIIPFREATFVVKFINGSTSETTEITPTDVLRYKLTRKVHGTGNEVFYQNCKRVACNVESVKVKYNGISKNILDYDVAIKTYANKNVYLQIIDLQENTPEGNITVTNYVNDAEDGKQVYDQYFDLVSTSENGIETAFTRNTRGLVTNESIGSLCSRSTSYGTNASGDTTITATDEFGKDTLYTLDSVWGSVKSVSLPDGTLVTDTYDDDMCALTKRTFGSASGRSNSLTYSSGNLSGLTSGALAYGFTYSAGKLTGVSKNSTSVEAHVHTGNSKTESYYPKQSGALHSTINRFDKYGRLSKIDGVLSNTYDLSPSFTSAGALNATEDNGSALLAMTTDSTQGETARFTYNKKNQLTKKAVTSASNFATKVSTETFAYDDIGRLTSNTASFTGSGFTSVGSSSAYKKSATSAGADNTVSSYTYKIGGTQKAKTTNTFDTYKRLAKKTAAISSSSFVKNFTYTKTRVTKVADQVSGVNIGTNSYTYDDLGRIKSDNYTAQSMTEQYKRYTYDQYGQLVREDNQALAKTFVYAYNDIGNLTSVKAYNYTQSTPSGSYTTTSFGYSADKLTSFGGSSISYNTMGCPTSYDGMSATWSKGKLSRLSSGTLASGTSNYTYTYNAFGQRVAKTYSYLAGTSGVGSAQAGDVTAYNKKYYYDHAGRLVAEETSKTIQGTGTVTERIVFLYDESSVIGMEHTSGGVSTRYYFQRNLLGDVQAIVNTNGTVVARYLYDAFGNCTIASSSTNTAVANANPIRYRGYYYDDDTGLYYCNARYYSPKWRRFISPDDTAYLDPEAVNGLNLHCYCNNDPINIKCSYGAAGKSHLPATVSAGHSTTSGINKPATSNWPVSMSMPHSKYALFGYEGRRSAGWEQSLTLLSSWLVRIGFSSYVTHTSGKPGILYAFAGATSDVMSLLDTTYYAGVGLDLFGILGAEVQAEFLGVGATISLGRLSIGVNANLLASTSLAFTWDTDLGSNLTRSDGFTIGINTPGVLMLVALACTYIWAVLNGIDSSAVPNPIPGYA